MNGMELADGGVTSRHRDVEHLGGEPGVELGGLELGQLFRKGRVDHRARFIGGLSDRLALLGGKAAHPLEDGGQLALFAEVLYPDGVQCGKVGGGFKLLLGLCNDPPDCFVHTITSYKI